MSLVEITRLDGGQDKNERSETINQATESMGFDIFNDTNKLTRLLTPTVFEGAFGPSVTAGECAVFDATKRMSDGRVIGVGVTGSTSSIFRFYRKDGTITGNWAQHSVAGGSVSNQNVYAILYKDAQYGVASLSSVTRLYRYDTDSAMTIIGDVADSDAIVLAKPLVHSQDDILYVPGSRTIGKYDGTTFIASAIVLPYLITSICEYQNYIAILCQSPAGGVIYWWGRDTSLATLQNTFPLDGGAGRILENIDGYLVGVSEFPYDSNNSVIGLSFSVPHIVVRMYLGGIMQKVKSALVNNLLSGSTSESPYTESGQTQRLLNKKMVKDGRLYFTTASNAVWCFGLNQDGKYVLSRNYKSTYQTRNVLVFYGMFTLGDYVFFNVRTDTGSPNDMYLTRITGDGYSSTDISYYTTTINPSMPIVDRKYDKTLKAFGIRALINNVAQGSIIVEISVDGGTFNTIISRDTLSTFFPSKVTRIDAGAMNDSTPMPTGREFKFRIKTTTKIDVLGYWYDYDVNNTLI